MKLHEFHVRQLRPSVIRQRLAVAGIFPTVAGDFERAPDATGGQHNSLRLEQSKSPALAVVTERAHDAAAIFEQHQDGAFHVNIHAAVHAVVLQCANHFQAGAVADVRQTRIFVSAEIALQDAAVCGAVEQRAPRFQFADAVGRLFCVQLGHAPVVEVLSAASAAAMPPSAMTVCALPSSDLQTMPTDTPAAEASIAARSPAPPAPMMSTSCSKVWYSGMG